MQACNRMIRLIYPALLLISHFVSSGNSAPASEQTSTYEEGPLPIKDDFPGHFSDPSAKSGLIISIG